jgi:hypothetical protein
MNEQRRSGIAPSFVSFILPQLFLRLEQALGRRFFVGLSLRRETE